MIISDEKAKLFIPKFYRIRRHAWAVNGIVGGKKGGESEWS